MHIVEARALLAGATDIPASSPLGQAVKTVLDDHARLQSVALRADQVRRLNRGDRAEVARYILEGTQ